MGSTYATDSLLEVRHYLQPLTGLPDYALGIVGDENHDGGYHHGWDHRQDDGFDYSWDEADRDAAHKTNAARALDVGDFDRLREMSNWLVEQCQNGAPDCADIREIIWSPDGKVVKRWDRLGIRDSGDSSHLSHTHISYFADAENNSKVGPFQRFFEGDDMSYTDNDRDTALADTYRQDALLQMKDAAVYTPKWNGSVEVKEPNKLKVVLEEIKAAVTGPSEITLSEADQDAIAKKTAALLEPKMVAALRTVFADGGSASEGVVK
jgi:hypothetical protein